MRSAWLTLWSVAYILPFVLGLPLALATGLGFTVMIGEGRATLPGHPPGWETRTADWTLAHLPDGTLRRKVAVRFENARRYPIREHYDFAQMYPGVPLAWDHVVLAAPLGFDPSHSLATYRSPQVDLGFYEGNENANTPAAVERKIAELAAHADRPVLIPGHAEDGAPPLDYRAMQHQLTMIVDFPYRARPRHLEPVYAPLYDYLRAHYRLAAQPSPANYLYELWLPAGR